MNMNRTIRTLILLFLTFTAYVAEAGSNQDINLTVNGLSMEVNVHPNRSASLTSLYQWHFTDASLFEIVVRDSYSDRADTLVSNKGWTELKIKKQGLSYMLTFSKPKDLKDADDLTVSLRIQLPNTHCDHWYEKDALRFTWEDCHLPETYTLESATLLPLEIEKLTAESHFFYPYASGIAGTSEEGHDAVYMQYPAGFGASMPWFAFWDKQGGGLYIGAHDRNATHKELYFEAEPNGITRLGMTYPGTDNRKFAPCEIVLAPFRGDWFDAAMMYKEWMKNESAWYPGELLGVQGRKDTPMWMKELCIWLSGNGFDKRVEDFQQEMGVPVGLHWYNWHQIPFDNDYPHYLPAKEGFRERTKELKEKHIYVMPYINGRLWDTRDHIMSDSLFTAQALPAVSKQKDGKPNTESYGSKEVDGSDVVLGVMCPATKVWRDKMAEVVLKLTEEEQVNGVYMDQIAAAPPRLCFDATHGHPTGGGDWWTPAYRELLANIRAKMNPEAILTTESNADGYVNQLDGYLTWQFQHENQVPAFAAVYGGMIQFFGRSYTLNDAPLANRMKLAQSLVFGEQLGWMSIDILQDKPFMTYLKEAVRNRYLYREFFYRGEMIKSPKLIGENPLCTAVWTFNGKHEMTMPSVLCGAWQIKADGRKLYLFTNYSDRQVTLDIEPAEGDSLEPFRHTFAPGEVYAFETR